MFLLSFQTNFYVILRSYVQGHMSFMSLLRSRPPKSGCFLGKLTAELVLKSFSGRNNSLEAHVFGFTNSLPYGPEESMELRALFRWVLG